MQFPIKPPGQFGRFQYTFGSLKTRLGALLSILVLLSTVTVGQVAYDTMFEALRASRLDDVKRVAAAKHDQLTMILTRANIRAEHFLSELIRQCTGNAGHLNTACATVLIKSYLATEAASGASLSKQGSSSDHLAIGKTASQGETQIPFQSGQLAKFSQLGVNSEHTYFVSVAEKSSGYRLQISYPASTLTSVFIPYPEELGLSGETFLADGEGFFVTRPKYPSTQGHSHPIHARPMQTCLAGQSGTVLDLDYRDAPIIHGFHFVPEFGAGCIMAHVTQEEAFLALASLQRRLFISLLVSGLVFLLAAMYVAGRIVKPVTDLSKVARAIAAGEHTAQAEVRGRDEISELATSFNDMTAQLRNSRDELQCLFNSMVEAAYGVDRDGNCSFVNRSFLDMMTYQNESEVLGKNMHELIHHSHADGGAHPGADCQICLACQSQQTGHFSDQVFWRKGKIAIPVECWSHPIVSSGAANGSIVTFVDTTERKKSEEWMRIAAVTFDSQEAIAITDAESNILRVNQAFQDLTGYTAQEVIGKNPRILQSGRHDAAFYHAMWTALTETGKWSGEVWDRRKNGEIYPKDMTITAIYNDQHQVTNYVAMSSDISQRKQSEQDIHQLAFYDPLTNLPNRRLLMDRLQQAMVISARSRRHGALLFLDLDHFKLINDSLGHAVGDLLLIEVAQRLQACVREGDSVARMGGDEFVVVLEELSSQITQATIQTRLVAQKILTELNQPYLLKEHICHSTPSIGIELFLDNHESIENLLKHADVAMYHAKNSGRNVIHFYDAGMQAEPDLLEAIKAN